MKWFNCMLNRKGQSLQSWENSSWCTQINQLICLFLTHNTTTTSCVKHARADGYLIIMNIRLGLCNATIMKYRSKLEETLKFNFTIQKIFMSNSKHIERYYWKQPTSWTFLTLTERPWPQPLKHWKEEGSQDLSGIHKYPCHGLLA